MGLFEPIWMTNNTSKIKKAKDEVFKIKDINKLKEIAIKAPLPEVKSAAAYNIDDENILKELYLNDNIEQSIFQENVLHQIRNKDMINEIALLDAKRNFYYCAYINGNLDDEVLRKIILDDNFKMTNMNYGRELLLMAIRVIDNIDDINKILQDYSNYDDIVKVANNQKDKIEGVKAYIGLCPTCHKEIVYSIYYDFYDDRQKEKSNFECGCQKFSVNSFDKECEIKKSKDELTGNYLKMCFNCGLPLERDTAGYRKCFCGIGKYYLPICIKIDKQEW